MCQPAILLCQHAAKAGCSCGPGVTGVPMAFEGYCERCQNCWKCSLKTSGIKNIWLLSRTNWECLSFSYLHSRCLNLFRFQKLYCHLLSVNVLSPFFVFLFFFLPFSFYFFKTVVEQTHFLQICMWILCIRSVSNINYLVIVSSSNTAVINSAEPGFIL